MQVAFSAPVSQVAYDRRAGLLVSPGFERAAVFPRLAWMECAWSALNELAPLSPVRQAAYEVRHREVHSGALGVLRASPQFLP